MKKILILLSLINVLLIGNTSSANQLIPSSTTDVWEHHINAWVHRDLTEITSDYSADSILIINGQLFRGPEKIKNVFNQLFKIFDRGNNRIDPVLNFDRIIYITWHFQPYNNNEFYGTDTFIIENGKIAVQTIASPLYDYFPVKIN